MLNAVRMHSWFAFCVVQSAVTVAYFLAEEPAAKDGLFLLFAGLSVGAMVTGLLLHRPVAAGPLVWFTVGMGLFFAAEIIWGYYEVVLGVESPFPGLADLAYLAVYPALFAGAALLVREAPDRRGIGLEAWIIAAGVGVLSWRYLMSPALADSTATVAARMVSVAYPVADILLVAILTRLLLLGLWHNRALVLIGASFLAGLLTDVVYTRYSLEGQYFTGIWFDIGWVLQYTLIAAALLHPSVSDIHTSVRAAAPLALRGRLTALALAGLVAPSVLAFDALHGSTSDVLVVTVIWAVLFVLVVTRMRDLTSALDGLLLQSRYRAEHDALTGLENRGSFAVRVTAALAAPTPGFAIAYIDLDRFKAINDHEGHQAGDLVLVAVAQRLRQVVRHGDAVARLGGDEFAIFVAGVATTEQIAVLDQRIRARLAGPIDLHGTTVCPEASIGIVAAQHGETYDDLLARADTAMYRHKRSTASAPDMVPDDRSLPH